MSSEEESTWPAGVRLISGPTLYLKFIAPPLAVVLGIAGSIGVAFFASKAGAQGRLIGVSSLCFMAPWVYPIVRYHFPLKEVWLGNDGLIVSNYRDQIDLPFGAIAGVTQLKRNRFRFVIVDLRDETIFGRRFTFVPLHRKICWPSSSSEDDVVIELRSRIESASRRKQTQPISRPGWSIVTDDELDGAV